MKLSKTAHQKIQDLVWEFGKLAKADKLDNPLELYCAICADLVEDEAVKDMKDNGWVEDCYQISGDL